MEQSGKDLQLVRRVRPPHNSLRRARRKRGAAMGCGRRLTIWEKFDADSPDLWQFAGCGAQFDDD